MGVPRIVRRDAGRDDRAVHMPPRAPRSARPAEPLTAAATSAGVQAQLRRPQVFVPLVAVLVMLGIALGLQPGGGQPRSPREAASAERPSPNATVTATPTSVASPTPRSTAEVRATVLAQGQAASANTPGATNDVAGARATASPTAELELSRQATACGEIRETGRDQSVQANLGGVAVRATHATAYPVDYLECILTATGTRDSLAIAGALARARREGATHAVVIDLWVTNGAREFAQVNLRTAQVAAAGQVFAPLATLNGRSEVVINSGQGRNVSLVVALANTVGTGTGPITLTVDAPLVGGKPTQGKFQLFLPMP